MSEKWTDLAHVAPVSGPGTGHLVMVWEVLDHQWFYGDEMQILRWCRAESDPNSCRNYFYSIKFKTFLLPMSLISDKSYEFGVFFGFSFAQHRVSLHSPPKCVLNTSPSNPKPWIQHSTTLQEKVLYQIPSKVLKCCLGSFSLLFSIAVCFWHIAPYIVSNFL